MNAPKGKPQSDNLPTTRGVMPLYMVSLVIALVMAVASAAGLLGPARVYPTDELRQSFVANDVVNLFIGLPILLGSMWATRGSSARIAATSVLTLS